MIIPPIHLNSVHVLVLAAPKWDINLTAPASLNHIWEGPTLVPKASGLVPLVSGCEEEGRLFLDQGFTFKLEQDKRRERALVSSEGPAQPAEGAPFLTCKQSTIMSPLRRVRICYSFQMRSQSRTRFLSTIACSRV